MKILIFSDIHLECQKDNGDAFFKKFENVDHDVCVVAGDLCDSARLRESIRSLARNLNKVILVNGNHESYGSSISMTVAESREQAGRYGNVHYLEQESVCIQGKWFHGCTLWFPYEKSFQFDRDQVLLEKGMPDFHRILNIREEVGEYNKNGADFLRRCVGKDDIVVTHHLPSYQCVDQKYKRSSSNIFFVSPIEDLYSVNQPMIHIFGHTHESVRMCIGKTELICNPYGYQDIYELNKNFRLPMVIEI